MCNYIHVHMKCSKTGESETTQFRGHGFHAPKVAPPSEKESAVTQGGCHVSISRRFYAIFMGQNADKPRSVIKWLAWYESPQKNESTRIFFISIHIEKKYTPQLKHAVFKWIQTVETTLGY